MRNIRNILSLFLFSALTSQGSALANSVQPDFGNRFSGELKVFTFTVLTKSPWKEITDYSASDVEIFGKEMAQLISLIDHTYIIYPNKSEGQPVIVKPVIYRSLDKIIRFYKTAIRKATIERELAIDELDQILQKGYACYSQETDQLEGLLSKSKTLEEIKNVFNQIILIKN